MHKSIKTSVHIKITWCRAFVAGFLVLKRLMKPCNRQLQSLLASLVSGSFQTMGMSRLISQLFFGFFFSWKYHTQASTMSSFSGCAKSTQTSQPTHTSCHSYTASHRAHQHTDGSVTILCWSFSLFLSLLQTIHHTEFVSQDCFCLLLSASYCYIHFCWDWIASFSVF